MPQEPEHGRRFARDMRRIREARNLTVGDVHDETKIPQGLIEAFEDKALFDHPQFNRVYLRSFVRTYAQVIEIDTEPALDALEEALSGRYAGSLAVAYLGEEPDELEEKEEVVEETGPGGESTETEEAEKPGQPKAKRAPGAGAKKKTASGDVPEEEKRDDTEVRPSFVSTTQATAAGFQRMKTEKEEAEAEASEDWTAQSPPSSVARKRAARRPEPGGPDRRWILGGVLIVGVGALVWILVSVLGGPGEQASTPVAMQDTAEAVEQPDTTPVASAAVPVNVPVLGDTMDVRIIATKGRVDPIRVTVDDDLRRPYWIEMGDSMMFRPRSRIVIEELLDSVNVKLEGIVYPMERRDVQGRIVITRDTAESFFASLRQGR